MSDLLHELDIGGVRLENNLILSPMAGYSDVAFRALCRRYGAGLVCTEMVAAPSVNHDNHVSTRKMTTLAEERPVSIQVFGNDVEEVARATRRVADQCDIIGFNFGCPAPQIKRAGCGAALLDHPELALDLVRAMDAATSKPLLVKMRLGNGRRIDIAAFGRRLVEAGADALILHGRTAADMYSGRADWSAVDELKRAVAVPVIGNGDIVDAASARDALRTSGADGIAIGRAALGNPAIFDEIRNGLTGAAAATRRSPTARAEDFARYAEAARAAAIPLGQIRNQALRFAKGFPGAKSLRTQLHALEEPADIVAAVMAATSAEHGRAPPASGMV